VDESAFFNKAFDYRKETSDNEDEDDPC